MLDLHAQAERLVELGLPRLAGLDDDTVREAARTAPGSGGQDLLVVRADLLRPSVLAPLMRRGETPGFVIEDMQDVDAFAPQVALPASPVYVVRGVDRGDHLANRSPSEALGVFEAEGRSPLLLGEGIHWVLQEPAVLERNHCFMTIGSRLPKPGGGHDSRTPAVWISNGTGRDGRARRDAAKVGWCWWNNRHTWLGHASAHGRDAA